MKKPFFAQFTPDQLRAGYARNAKGLRAMLAKAERTGRKVNGYTAEYLRAKVTEYDALSTASDDVIIAQVNRPVPHPSTTPETAAAVQVLYACADATTVYLAQQTLFRAISHLTGLPLRRVIATWEGTRAR
jgi:hypothetical protein